MFRRVVAAVAVLTLALALPVSSWALSVYVLSSGDIATDLKVNGLLTLKGHTVTLGPEWFVWDGTQADLSGYDALVFLNNHNWQNAGDMPVAGQDAIVAYVGNGGGLVTGEWVDYQVNIGKLQNLKPVLPTTYANYNYYSSSRYVQVKANKTLNRKVPTAFRFPTNSLGGSEVYLVKKAGAISYYKSSNTKKVGVAGWRYGAGRVISFSTLLSEVELKNKYYKTLFANAVRWSAL